MRTHIERFFLSQEILQCNSFRRSGQMIHSSKRNKAKRNSSLFFRFFHLFSLNFRFASIFSLNFRLFYLRFRFRFLVFRIEVNHVKSGIFFASKRNKIFASISNFAYEAKVRAHPNCSHILAQNSVPTLLLFSYYHSSLVEK